MKLELEGDPRELAEKGPDLLKALANRLGLDLSTVADSQTVLNKSKSPESRVKALRDSIQKTNKIYDGQMDAMMEEIEAYLRKVK